MTTQKKPAKTKKNITYIAYLASSIDGRIAQSGDSGVNWTSPEDWRFFQNALSKADAVIVGHHTYAVSKSRLDKRNSIVLTSKVAKSEIKGKTLFFNPEKGNLKKFIQAKNYKKVAVIGGGKVYDFCLRNNMMDEFFVTIEPYVFTAGVSSFAGKSFKKYKFSLQSVKKLNKKGTLLLQYKNAN